jgi:hypothetical protein
VVAWPPSTNTHLGGCSYQPGTPHHPAAMARRWFMTRRAIGFRPSRRRAARLLVPYRVSMKPAACRLLCLMILVASAACEDCPNRRVQIELQPDGIPRGAMQEVEVRFPTAVFIGEHGDRQKDVRTDLRVPGGAIVGAWRGDRPGAGSGAVTQGRIVDPNTLALRLRFERSAKPGPYELTVIGDLAGACLGTWGTSILTVT